MLTYLPDKEKQNHIGFIMAISFSESIEMLPNWRYSITLRGTRNNFRFEQMYNDIGDCKFDFFNTTRGQ